MFEKSLYDLIKGLRTHKGNEKDYIEHSLRECRQEIRGSDMDLKATALLKLVYLEMFGHDMSWAAFNILEVMSAPKYYQKRVGYLGAVQTFGPTTDVLMLATNLLKKDVTSASVPTISLPLVAIPHLVTPGLANAVGPDLLARMSHSNPNIRKKSIVTLYRLALSWPEVLRPAWPKMKDILEKDDEDPAVTATVVNVICELVWRRPEDFLPLAPRFFELLIEGGNNWMVIKLIKLFATLTPSEPRLIKKLAPALTNLIRTTPAMSVLYECIHGIIQGGILDGVQGIREGDEIAELCVSKLCGMIAVEGDPNLKYVALLAFNDIVLSHPQLVSAQQDVIVSCLDDSDVSIRTQALTLVSGMVDADNLATIIEKLLLQLHNSKPKESALAEDEDAKTMAINQNSVLNSFGVDTHEYCTSIVKNILEMCSRNMYSNIIDFDWYIDVLVQMVQLAPQTTQDASLASKTGMSSERDVFETIGQELRNIAVRVKAARPHAVAAASSLLSALGQHEIIRNAGMGAYYVLAYAAFLAGEYPGLLPNVEDTLSALLLPFHGMPPAHASCAYLQAIPKVLSFVCTTGLGDWSNQRQSMVTLLVARVIHYMEDYANNANIEVQERAVSALELMRLADAALSKHESSAPTAPKLISNVIPSLFAGPELNPVAATAQGKVPLPDLDLEMPINQDLNRILQQSDQVFENDEMMPAVRAFYYTKDTDSIPMQGIVTASSQIPKYSLYDEHEVDQTSRKKEGSEVVRQDRELYDPFYIKGASTQLSGISTPVHDIIHDSNGTSLDIDSIPILELDLGNVPPTSSVGQMKAKRTKPKRTKSRAQITGDETLEEKDGNGITAAEVATARLARRPKSGRPLLGIDSSGLESLSSSPGRSSLSHSLSTSAPQTADSSLHNDAEMKKALAEVERLRLEMQRAQERVTISQDIPIEGTMITKKKKKKEKDKAGVKKTKKQTGKDTQVGAQAEPQAQISGSHQETLDLVKGYQ